MLNIKLTSDETKFLHYLLFLINKNTVHRFGKIHYADIRVILKTDDLKTLEKLRLKLRK